MNEFTTKIIPKFRALLVTDEEIIGARGYNILKYDINTARLSKQSAVIDRKYAILSQFFLTRRFFRAEITNLYELSDGTQLLIAKKGIFRKEKNSNTFFKCFHIPRGSRPMNLCIDEKDNIYFGEYFSNFEKKPVNIYASFDKGLTWKIVYTFLEGEINHIHGIFYDKYTNRKWVVTGDRENECIIGYTDNDFQNLNIVFRGGQEYRTCNLLFFNDFIVFITDSQYIPNEIKKFDRKTLEITSLQFIEGSGIYAGQNNSFSFVSTTIEPSTVNLDQYSHLYISEDGLKWAEIAKYKKDKWHKSAFQFGSIQFPRYKTNHLNNFIVYSGRSLNNIGNKTVVLVLKEKS
ncbi:hypothetical protein RDV77_04805 [Porphyromonadaceae sp. NP-X]|jgi:hypothetical protein|nr:hypothetical protein [Porphyromonadaceae sp. NP-X]